ncbi:LacI family DNA-binding transcriptional regulator [uncultured Friedmanniella sp.]|uniref:LacI family DNA-binding transcriptional regulator n=1 Tax=uncultured Friedmanniella sp. TaxID=335381 RepID=UPI0035CA6BA9
MATPGHRRPPTMEDVAARAQVSRALVSIVFRDLPGASDATRERVRQAAQDLGYAPDQRARLLSRRRTGLLGVQFGIEHPFHGELVEALYTAAEARGHELALSAVARTRAEDRAVESLLSYRCEALILLGPRATAARIDALGARVPVVVVARHLRSRQVDVVRTDDVDGARQATRHLIGLGHRAIAHVDGGGAPGTADRRRGYQQAMEQAGLADQVRVLRGGLTEQAGAGAGAALLDARLGDGRPTAVFAFNDRCALGVVQAADRLGSATPTDLSVVGFDDSRVATLPWVQLTTVRQDTRQLAVDAVDHAVARLDGSPRAASSIVAPRLVVRSSTAHRRQ